MDVFLSYAAEDRDRARQVAEALKECGWSVWWDRNIVAGEAFDQTIERQLESAKCVVVLWSNASVASEWVKNEAASAAERQVLVPALLDDVKIPLEFRRRQTANLLEWEGNASHEGFQALREGVAARVGAEVVAPAPQASAPVSHPVKQLPLQRWGIVAGSVALIALASWGIRTWITAPPDQPTSGSLDSSRGLPAPDAKGKGPRAPSKVVSVSGGHSVDSPAPLAFGALHKVTLERNETIYFQLVTAANAFTIIEDVRLQNRERGNLQTKLSILDTDGGVVQSDIIRFNELDVGYRKTVSFSVKQPVRFGFKLVNVGSRSSDVWLTVTPEGQKQFLPFFGEVVPRPWPAGKDAAGTLEKIEDAYYLVRLPRGENRVILDFTNAKRERSNLQGYLAVLAADGGAQEEILHLNELDTTYRMVGSISVKTDEPLILRLQNNGSTAINYNLRIASAR